MATDQISGKVFRFLSAMHPSLSKTDRKRYAEFEPDTWYPWTPEVAGEFTDLMRRSPRDTSFARGFAYAAQKGVPEGRYICTPNLLESIASLPAAYKGDGGSSGFSATVEGDGRATVTYRGMPGFSNVCIAIRGELTQRLQGSGATGLDVRHTQGCRLQGGDTCHFEVSWSGVVVPKGAQPVDPAELLGGDGFEIPPDIAATGPESATNTAVEEEATATVDLAASSDSGASFSGDAAVAASGPEIVDGGAGPSAAPAATEIHGRAAGAAAASAVAGASQVAASEIPGRPGVRASVREVVEQFEAMVAEADKQARLNDELEGQVVSLRAELDLARKQAQSDLAAARSEAAEAHAELDALKKKILAIVEEG